MKLLTTIVGLLASSVAAAPAPLTDNEVRALPKVSVTLPGEGGSVTGVSAFGVESFRGVPFANPPTGPLRLKPPTRWTSKLQNWDATGIAPGCPQMFISNEAIGLIGNTLNALLDIPFLQVINGQEDCLTVSVQRPAGVAANAKLPVLFWIFGGGFELGSTNTYDGTSLLNFGKDQSQPFIFVAVNYRVGGFGFMAGKEILADGSSNLGLLDQRMGLEWVADNIAAFGGDPEKVTIWGESAGAISVFDQMALYGGKADYKGKPLFRGAIMNSGSLAPADPVDCPKGQNIYDQVVKKAGCAGKPDTLQCLREVPYKTFLDAANSVPGIIGYSSVALSYLPRPDGVVLPASPDILAAQGRYYPVPMIVGDQEDEGTLFALFQPNITTSSEIVTYLKDYYFNAASTAQLTALVKTYDPWIWEGSPFRTSLLNEWYPGFKRLAAILGDLVFTLTRRVFLDVTRKAHPTVPSWSYLASYDYGTPIMGTFHASDILQVFYGQFANNAMRSSRTYYFNFLYNLNPNVGVTKFANWPEYKDGKQLLWFETGNSNSYLKDDFREDSAKWIVDNAAVLNI